MTKYRVVVPGNAARKARIRATVQVRPERVKGAKVVCYYDSEKVRSKVLARAAKTGFDRIGLKSEVISQEYYRKPEHEVAVFYGLHRNHLRILKDYNASGKTTVLFDLGYWGRLHGSKLQGYHRIAVNGLHSIPGLGDFKYDDKRFKVHRVPLTPFDRSGKHIVICGQSAKAAGVYELAPGAWEKHTIETLKGVTDRELIYYPKPSWDGAVPLPGTVFYRGELKSIFNEAWMVVAHHSNSCLHALEHGIPIYLDDGIAKVLSSNDLSDVDNPFIPTEEQRDQLMFNAAYCQWSVGEISAGLMWRYLDLLGILDGARK